MKPGKVVHFFILLFLSALACNMPNVSANNPEGGGTLPAPAEMTNTPIVVVIENTPTLAQPTETPIPVTPTLQVSPKLTLTSNSNCRIGPNANYNVVDQISSGMELSVIGRNEENTWWEVVNATGRECWVIAENATTNTDFITAVSVDDAPPLPGVPQNFFVVNQICQPGPKKFTVSFTWASGGGETAFRLYRNGERIAEVKASRLDYRDINAPLNKNISYELEAVNENGTSDKAVQIVPACK